MQDYKKLEVWKKAHIFVKEMYVITVSYFLIVNSGQFAVNRE